MSGVTKLLVLLSILLYLDSVQPCMTTVEVNNKHNSSGGIYIHKKINNFFHLIKFYFKWYLGRHTEYPKMFLIQGVKKVMQHFFYRFKISQISRVCHQVFDFSKTYRTPSLGHIKRVYSHFCSDFTSNVHFCGHLKSYFIVLHIFMLLFTAHSFTIF